MRRIRILPGPIALGALLISLPAQAQTAPTPEAGPGTPGARAPAPQPVTGPAPAAQPGTPAAQPGAPAATPAPPSGPAAPQPAGAEAELAREPGSDAIRALNERFDEQRRALNEEYGRRVEELQGQYMTELADLAAKSQGPEAEEAYRRLFAYAIATDQYEPAEPAAQHVLQAGGTISPALRDLAEYVRVVSQAENEQYDQAVRELRSYLDQPEGQRPAPDRAFALAEDLIQRLTLAGRYELAQQIPALFLGKGYDAPIEAHFQARQTQLGLIGKPAPPITAVDIDGQPFRLSDLKGKAVLLDFWATWCPPCLAQIPHLSQIRAKYGEKGFEIVGVDVDLARQGAGSSQEVMQVVRQVLIDYGVTWPNLLSGAEGQDIAQAYGVNAIPFNVLIGTDGRVVALAIPDQRLDEAIAGAVGQAQPGQQPAGATPGR